MREEFTATWNDVFSVVSPSMIGDGVSEPQVRKTINGYIEAQNVDKIREMLEFDQIKRFEILDRDFQTIKVQLRALGLIMKSAKPRSLKDTDTYWTLTPYGDAVMTKLRAIRRQDSESSKSDSHETKQACSSPPPQT
jgi:hypothetical protein